MASRSILQWIEWAATEKVSETVAAAVLLICETRPVHEVVAKLTPGEFERVVDIVRRSPDHFPRERWPRSRGTVRYRQAGRNRIVSRPISRADRALSHRAAKSAAASAICSASRLIRRRSGGPPLRA